MKWVRISFNHRFTSNPSKSLLPEFNVLQPSPLNDKVLKEKRKKLKETFDRVMRLYVSNFTNKNSFSHKSTPSIEIQINQIFHSLLTITLLPPSLPAL